MPNKQIVTTLGELADAEPTLQMALSVKVDAKLRYHLLKLAGLVRQETKNFWKIREEIYKDLGKERLATPVEVARGVPGSVWDVPPEKRKELQERLSPLRLQPITLPWEPISGAEVEPYVEMTGEILFGLGPLFQLDPSES